MTLARHINHSHQHVTSNTLKLARNPLQQVNNLQTLSLFTSKALGTLERSRLNKKNNMDIVYLQETKGSVSHMEKRKVDKLAIQLVGSSEFAISPPLAVLESRRNRKLVGAA